MVEAGRKIQRYQERIDWLLLFFSRKYGLNQYSPWKHEEVLKQHLFFSTNERLKARPSRFQLKPQETPGILTFRGLWVGCYWARKHRMWHLVSIISREIALPVTPQDDWECQTVAILTLPSDSVCCNTLHTSDQVTTSIYFSSFHLTHH